MDKAQIQHAIDMIEMYQGQLLERLLDLPEEETNIKLLEAKVRSLQDELWDAESERDGYKDVIDEAIDLLQDLVDRNVTTSDIEAIIKHLQE